MTRLFRRLPILAAIVLLAAAPLFALPTLGHQALTIGPPAASSPATFDDVAPWLLTPFAFGAIRIKDTASLAKKFVQRAQTAAGDYAEGVKAAGGDWEANTKASEQNYVAAVTQAASEGRFGRGISAAGSTKYTQRAGTLGAQRFGPGVAASEGEWQRGSAPYLDRLKSLDLPPRRPKGQNGDRANAVAMALRNMKLGK